MKHTVLPDDQPPTVAFTVIAQLCGRKANEMEMDVALFTTMTREGTLTMTLTCLEHIKS